MYENHLFIEEERQSGYSFYIKKNVARWFIFLLIGVVTAIIGVLIDIAIDVISNYKYSLIKKRILLNIKSNYIFSFNFKLLIQKWKHSLCRMFKRSIHLLGMSWIPLTFI